MYVQIKWEPTEDRGPNGAVGKATFDPSFAVALIVTIYGVSIHSVVLVLNCSEPSFSPPFLHTLLSLELIVCRI